MKSPIKAGVLNFLLCFLARHKILFYSVLIIGFLVSGYFLINAPQLHKTGILVSNAGTSRVIELPLVSGGQNVREFAVTTQIQVNPGWPGSVRIIPDDCIVDVIVNGKPVSLVSFSLRDLCNLSDGIDIDLSNELHIGLNSIQVTVSNTQGNIGLAIEFIPDPLRLRMILLVFSIFCLVGLWIFIRRFCFSSSVNLIFLTGFLICLFQVSYTDYRQRATGDLLGHLQHVQKVTRLELLPKTNECWECYQAPLYYWVAAPLYSLTKMLLLDPLSCLRFLSLVYFMIFLVYSVLTIRELLGVGSLATVATMFVVFFPSGFMHSARIGNEILFYAFYSGGLYYLVLWDKALVRRHLILSSVFTSLALLTKASGVMLVLVFFLVYFWNLAVKSKINQRRLISSYVSQKQSFAILTVGALLYIACVIPKGSFGNRMHLLPDDQAVANDLINFLWFDLKIFLTQPFTSIHLDSAGRQYFWNYFLKTMAFGEFTTQGEIYKTLALVISVGLLGTMTLVSIGLFFERRQYLISSPIPLINLIVPLFFSIGYRVWTPFSCNQDFRFVYPMVISFGYFLFKGAERLSSADFVFPRVILLALVTIFIVAGVAFYTLPVFILNKLITFTS